MRAPDIGHIVGGTPGNPENGKSTPRPQPAPDQNTGGMLTALDGHVAVDIIDDLIKG